MRRYLILSVVLLMTFLSGGCASKTETVEPSPSNSSSPKPTSSGAVIPDSTQSAPNPPPKIYIKWTGFPDGASYMPGQVTNTTISFTNISAEPFKISTFPPEFDIRPFTSTMVIRHFAPGNDEVQLNAGETAKYILTWDQKDDNGKQVDQGLYAIDALNVKMSNTPQVWGGYVTTILIKNP